MAIERFKGDYAFLSSMSEVKGGIQLSERFFRPVHAELVVVAGPTVEHPYQASKFDDLEAVEQILAARDGVKAKDIAEKLIDEEQAPVREDWEDVRLDIMRDLVGQKFVSGTRLAYLLLQTGDEELVEGNTWGDTFWGVSPPGSGNGQNWLGRILMETRQTLRAQPKKK